MADPIRAAAERLLQQLKLPSGTPYAGQLLEQAESELRLALAAAPPAPDPREALAARPLLEAVARMADRIGQHTVGEITVISDRAAAWLAENPPGQPVAIEPRGCPAPGACSCVEPSAPDHLRGATEMAAHSARLRQCPTHGQQPAHTWGCPECLRELREELARVKATVADGERKELADRLGWIAAQLADIGWGDDSASVARAAALLRELPPPDLVPFAYDAGDGVQILRITSEDGSWSVRNSRHVSPITGFSTAAAAWAALQQARRQAAAVAEDFRRQILAAAAALQDHPPGHQPGDSVFFSGGEVFCVNRIGADSCWPSLARPEEPPQGGEVAP